MQLARYRDPYPFEENYEVHFACSLSELLIQKPVSDVKGARLQYGVG